MKEDLRKQWDETSSLVHQIAKSDDILHLDSDEYVKEIRKKAQEDGQKDKEQRHTV